MVRIVKVTDVGRFIREQREGAKLSLRKLAKAAGVSNPYLSQIERGLRRPSADILQAIAKGLRISAETLYVRAGMLDEREQEDFDLEKGILSDPGITEKQKQALIQVYNTFRDETARRRDRTRKVQ
ncbi:MAG TPA: helix-turn-helix transcriptional regulator [Actinomycetota bacterium]|jgi:transcriptional regulator with XRE-family HTH domain|nr:helix-turn-helix transcriptional regulator [Actinomycetota bacterium]